MEADDLGQMRLALACEREGLEAAEGLLRCGRAGQSSAALAEACAAGAPKWAKRLLENGADAGWADCAGRTALYWATAFGHEGCMELLAGPTFEAGAMERADMQGRTALLMAAWSGYEGRVRMLMEAGADPMARDALGLGLAEYGEKNGLPGLGDLLGSWKEKSVLEKHAAGAGAGRGPARQKL